MKRESVLLPDGRSATVDVASYCFVARRSAPTATPTEMRTTARTISFRRHRTSRNSLRFIADLIATASSIEPRNLTRIAVMPAAKRLLIASQPLDGGVAAYVVGAAEALASRYDVEVACPRDSTVWAALSGHDGIRLSEIGAARQPSPGDLRTLG